MKREKYLVGYGFFWWGFFVFFWGGCGVWGGWVGWYYENIAWVKEFKYNPKSEALL